VFVEEFVACNVCHDDLTSVLCGSTHWISRSSWFGSLGARRGIYRDEGVRRIFDKNSDYSSLRDLGWSSQCVSEPWLIPQSKLLKSEK